MRYQTDDLPSVCYFASSLSGGGKGGLTGLSINLKVNGEENDFVTGMRYHLKGAVYLLCSCVWGGEGMGRGIPPLIFRVWGASPGQILKLVVLKNNF